jgi:PAS domain S-box-containing protein
MDRIDSVFATGMPIRVEDSVKVGDRLIYSDSVISPIKDRQDKIFAVGVVYRDITEKNELQNQLKELTEKYQNLYNQAQVPLYRTRLSDGKLLECNDRLATLLGYENKEQCLKSCYSSKKYSDPVKRDELIMLLAEKGYVEGFKLKTQKLDGSVLWVEVSAQLYKDKGYIEGAMWNITTSKILTPAEIIVLNFVLQGKTNKDIAKELSRSARTIEEHRSHIMKKMGVNNLVELAQKAVELGID